MAEMCGRRRGVFWERAIDIIIYLLKLPAENVCWNCHIIYRLGCWNSTSGVAEEHHHRQDCWDNGSRVAGRHRRWGLVGHVRFRGRCIIIWIARKAIHNARGRTHI